MCSGQAADDGSGGWGLKGGQRKRDVSRGLETLDEGPLVPSIFSSPGTGEPKRAGDAHT